MDSRRVPRVPRYLGATGKRIAISDTGLSPSLADLSRSFSYRFPILLLTSTTLFPSACLRSRLLKELLRLLWSCNPALTFRFARFRLFRFRSPLLSESRLFSLPPGTEMVHFPGFAPYTYVFSARYRLFSIGGFPHSDISGSLVACTSPKLFAAGHVLHRLFVPRHPHACS